MAIVRRTLKQAKTAARVDMKRLRATTEEDIRRHMIEDGEKPGAKSKGALVQPPRAIRESLGLTQEQFAAKLRVPVGTVRNWEQGRVLPDPAARSLLNIVAREPKAALRALAVA